jgi:hypothetical protein
MSNEEQAVEYALSAYRSLADSRGVDLRMVLDAAASGDLRPIVRLPEVRRRSRHRRMSVRQAQVRLRELVAEYVAATGDTDVTALLARIAERHLDQDPRA